MISDEKLKRLLGVVDPATGLLWAMPQDGSPPVLVTLPSGVNEEFRNVINASIMLYNVVDNCKELLNSIHDVSVDRGDELLIGPVTAMAAACQTAQRCAIEGIDKIAAKRK